MTRNIELKVRCSDLSRMREVAHQIGASYQATIHQTDTYFSIEKGRLKLRKEVPGQSKLIFYSRPDLPQLKASDYYISVLDSVGDVERVLVEALGVRNEVRKERELWTLPNTRLHLDTVEGLGTFVELELIVDSKDSESECWEQAQRLIVEFGFSERDFLSGSYADLVTQVASNGGD